MKHIKLFEEVSTPISQELLGVMNNPENLTKKAFFILFDKYARNNDSNSAAHLMNLAKKYQPEWRKDMNYIDSLGNIINKYNLDWADDEFNAYWTGTPEERAKAKSEYELSKMSVKRYENLKKFKDESSKIIMDLIYKYELDGIGVLNNYQIFIKSINDLIKDERSGSSWGGFR